MPEYSTSKTAFAFLIVGVLLFGVSLNDPFHFDDALILKDSNVTNATRWFHFFNPLHLRQLTFFSFYLNYLIGGDNPFGFHVVNVLIHIANAILLLYLLKRFLDPWVATLAASIFLVHPVQTEPVVYIYQRSVLLACLFSLLALHAYHRGRHWLAGLLFFLAFESKESALAVPLALGLLQARARKWLIAGVGAGAGAALGLLAYWNESTVGFGAADTITPAAYFVAQLRVAYTYLRLLVWPYPQSLEYEFPPASPAGWVIAQGLGLAAIVAVAVFAAASERRRIPGLAVLAFFILLAPTSSVIPSTDAAFEHRLYLPMLAFAVFAAWLCAKIPMRTAAAVVLLAAMMVMSLRREMVWRDGAALWEDAALKAPGKTRVWFNLGGAHLNTNPVRAKEAFGRALQLQPYFPEVYYNLGLIEQNQGNHPGAAAFYQRAIEQNDGYWPAWNNLGNVMFALDQRERAIDHLQTTLRLNPDYWPAQYNIAIIHYASGRFEQAIPRLRTVLDWRPDYNEARQLLALALRESGQRNAADEEFKKLAARQSQAGIIPPMIQAPARP